MKYIKINENIILNRLSLNDTNLFKNELLTIKEYKEIDINLKKEYFKIVNINKNNTVFFFGIRKEIIAK